MRSLVAAARCGLLFSILLGAAAEAPAREADLAAEPTREPSRELVAHPADPARRVEIYRLEPSGEGPWPAMLYVHGYQPPGERIGGRFYADRGILADTAADGIFAAAVSQPDFGASDGPPDFCGPMSHQAVHAALAVLRADPRIDPDRIVLYGDSRGAVVSSMVAVQDPGLAGLVLRGGVYDLGEAYARMDDDHPIQGGIKENIALETGATPEAFRQRSALLADEPIRVPTLILHGENDVNTPLDIARRLAEQLEAAGTPVEMVVFPGVGHIVPMELRREHVERFLARVLGPLQEPSNHQEISPTSTPR